MGSCGCGDFGGLAQFPGPGDTVYVLDLYCGCRDCDESPGPTIRRLTQEEMEEWDCQDLPQADFGRFGDLAITPLFGATLRRLLTRELEPEVPDINELLRDCLADCMMEAAGEVATRWRDGDGRFPWRRGDETGY